MVCARTKAPHRRPNCASAPCSKELWLEMCHCTGNNTGGAGGWSLD